MAENDFLVKFSNDERGFEGACPLFSCNHFIF